MNRISLTVPTVPAGAHAASAVRKVITGVDRARVGVHAVLGYFVGPGDVVEVDVGALLLVVDREALVPSAGRARHPAPGRPALAVHLADPDATDVLRPVWSASYATAESTYGAATLNALGRLLAAHPPAGGGVRTITEA
ncbi:hypothetical protein AB0I28_08750 [Phytomonospora sp. NPDC050363]|uniref:hypothetical protein n=1 Tax=Phytomonospora sp. NPDC050363 TaxID=3155642 RepID=UPI0033DA0274